MQNNGWYLEHTYTQLPEFFYRPQRPASAPAPRMAVFNRALAGELGLDADALEQTPALFAGTDLPSGSVPIAQAYAGYQFGHFTMLGDGRAVLLGEQRTPGGGLADIQLKGSGPTMFSRGGDGYAALLPMLREYIISEAMHALGIPTTRSLAVVLTGGKVKRERIFPGAVLTRVAASHIRVGTFNYAAAFGSAADVRALADYSIRRHFPGLENAKDKYPQFFKEVAARQAKLIAQWQCVGFIHGVMNTDNMAISGETIDYGPCAFMDAYDPDTVFSSIDTHGRYAYKNQPKIGAWNLTRLAESLKGLLTPEQAEAGLAHYWERYRAHYLAEMRTKMNITRESTADEKTIDEFLQDMADNGRDFTQTFRAMSHASPAIIPRNHRVEEALIAAGEGDFSVMHELLSALRKPYEDNEKYAQPPPTGCGCGYKTFCGT
ncbi:MAG: YdiU family protein [Defluviitaleaceae bacterium]|nr:YdiU family protein [Defluviitaleaceae bacterium]MCL2239902.1 YdiU family protein [Defluviitaleaceae bacterium]